MKTKEPSSLARALVFSALAFALLLPAFAFAAPPKPIKDLFPILAATINPADYVIYPTQNTTPTPPAEFHAFYDCQSALNLPAASQAAALTAKCTAALTPPRFYDVRDPTHMPGPPGPVVAEVTDTYDLINTCVGVRTASHYIIGPIAIDPVAKTVNCPVKPDEIVEAHVMICYGKAGLGAFCQLATACFEGSAVPGRCTRDYPADDLLIAKPI